MAVDYLLKDVGSVGLGPWVGANDANETLGVRSFQAGILGSGTPNAVVNVYGANDQRFPKLLMTFTLAGPGDGTTSDVADSSMPYAYFRAEVVSISAGGQVSLAMKS